MAIGLIISLMGMECIYLKMGRTMRVNLWIIIKRELGNIHIVMKVTTTAIGRIIRSMEKGNITNSPISILI